MAGPWPHPKTGILYYRKATPPDLWDARDRLAAIGVKVTREVQRSLGTKDQRPAELRYHKIAAEQEAEWQRWAALLENGPQPLSHKKRIGLAADHARAFLAKHDDEPNEAPQARPLPMPVQLPSDPSQKRAVALEAATILAQTLDAPSLAADFMEFYDAEGERGRQLGLELLDRHPGLAALQYPFLAAALEATHGTDTDEALAAHGVNVDEGTRVKINLEMVRQMAAVREGLEARKRGDYGPVEALEKAPVFVAAKRPERLVVTKAVPLQGSPDAYPSMLFLLHHRASRDSLRHSTVRGDEGYIGKFIKFVGHDDATRVTKKDVRDWRDSLIAQTTPTLTSKTIGNKYLSALKATLQHGVREFDLPFNAASGITDKREGAAPTRSKGWTDGEAVAILSATFKGVAKGISLPHRRAAFWAPWIMAYTGLRVSEVAQLRGCDLREDNGLPHLVINPASGDTKSGKAWATGIHSHLIEMGLLHFIQGIGDGPLFYEPLKDGLPLTAAERRSRVQDAYQAVTDWVKDELGMEAPLGRPNHAWRHLFTTRSRQFAMDKEARDFMMGSRPEVDAREGYGDWPPTVLDREINKQPRFQVWDTGWRP